MADPGPTEGASDANVPEEEINQLDLSPAGAMIQTAIFDGEITTEPAAIQSLKNNRNHPVEVRRIPGRITPDDVRARLAFVITGIYGGTITAAIILYGLVAFFAPHGTDFKPAQELIENLLAAETGIFGSIIGFYFGGKTADK